MPNTCRNMPQEQWRRWSGQVRERSVKPVTLAAPVLTLQNDVFCTRQLANAECAGDAPSGGYRVPVSPIGCLRDTSLVPAAAGSPERAGEGADLTRRCHPTEETAALAVAILARPFDAGQALPASMRRMKSPTRGFLPNLRTQARNWGKCAARWVQIPPPPPPDQRKRESAAVCGWLFLASSLISSPRGGCL
jgi:hypothetical protein